MAKSIMGTKGSMGALSRLRSDAPQPHWKMATTTPKAAPSDSRFMTTAFSGTSTDRKTVMSSRNDRPRTAPKKRGMRAVM